jgi:3-phenylpropionate/trans-cinnamate dioxygenase ferredoxin subunit
VQQATVDVRLLNACFGDGENNSDPDVLARIGSGKTRMDSGMSSYIQAGSLDELMPGQRKLVFAGGLSIALFNIGGTLSAIENSCPHNGASLANGQLEGALLRCPAHGLRFDVTTGCMPGPAGLRLRTFPVRVVEDRMEIVLDEAPAQRCDGLACSRQNHGDKR